jgi:para-aminobenzoate synthetase component 1
VYSLSLTADQVVSSLLRLSENEIVCILDSCGVGDGHSNLLLAGIRPKAVIELSNDDPQKTLEALDGLLCGDQAVVFSISYDLGSRLHGIQQREESPEPDVFAAAFDCLIQHDYRSGATFLSGGETRVREIAILLSKNADPISEPGPSKNTGVANSNFTASEYKATVEAIRELIRAGETYQVNLTQQINVDLPVGMTPQLVFQRLRKNNPAAFSAFIKRRDSTVVSASPERFIRLEGNSIFSSPIKGTRPRGRDSESDLALRRELLASEKDRAENTMIVDLIRNDLGRICEFGSVYVERLCDLEEHPTLFHLVSTVRGELCPNLKVSDILRATFPCGSITGAPKIRTMQIIDRLEPAVRGLSMGAIGYYLPKGVAQGSDPILDLSVAIRTMVIRNDVATFNVGGGIVIDSDAADEYEESMLKAEALLQALGSRK